MVLERATAFAMRCPECGRLQIDRINIFELSGNSSKGIYCECGNKKATIIRKGSEHIQLEYYCIICEQKHSVYLPASRFWSQTDLHPLLCPNTSLNLGYYGSYLKLQEELSRQEKELNSLASELGFDDFTDPELMLKVLDYLHDIAADSGLYCECGSHEIDIELYSDKVELNCSQCGASLVIPASYKQDLKKLKMADELVLTKGHSPRPSNSTWVKNTYKEE